MLLGIGSGHAVRDAIARLGERVRDEGLDLQAVPASPESAALLATAGIKTLPGDDLPPLDLGIDGADFLTPSLDLLKGLGGALAREKIVALSCRRWVIAADTGKLRDDLSSLPVPVEVLAFRHENAARRIGALGYRTALRRTRSGEPFWTANGNPVYDCSPEPDGRPCRAEEIAERAAALKALPGVVETGYFFGMADLALLSDGQAVRELHAELGT